MTKLIPVIFVVLGLVGVVAWIALNLRAKKNYDQVRIGLAQHSYEVVPFDAETTALLEDVRRNWTKSHSQVGGPHSNALKLLTLEPSVSNLVHIFTYRLPEYSFLFAHRNKEAATMAMIQALLMPSTIDESIHFSDDGHTALVRCHTNVVYIYSDESAGLRESLYLLKKGNIGQADEREPE